MAKFDHVGPRFSQTVKLTETQTLKYTIEFREQNKVRKYNSPIFHITFNLHMSHASYESFSLNCSWKWVRSSCW